MITVLNNQEILSVSGGGEPLSKHWNNKKVINAYISARQSGKNIHHSAVIACKGDMNCVNTILKNIKNIID
jgi:hypothetical protein